MITLTRTTNLAPLSEKEAALARQSGSAIAGFIDGEEPLVLTLTGADGRRLEATAPAFALRLLAQVLEEMAAGRPVTLIPSNAELTTHQAADLLGVSRPYLIKQLEAGKIPFRKVGTHRRIRYDDLRAYQEREREERHRGLDELVALSEEMGLYEMESDRGSKAGR
jgi:excisionase family DNA binding protein